MGLYVTNILRYCRGNKKAINKNIWYMFELVEANCDGLSYDQVLCDIFQQYIIDTNFEKCVTTVKHFTTWSRTIMREMNYPLLMRDIVSHDFLVD